MQVFRISKSPLSQEDNLPRLRHFTIDSLSSIRVPDPIYERPGQCGHVLVTHLDLPLPWAGCLLRCWRGTGGSGRPALDWQRRIKVVAEQLRKRHVPEEFLTRISSSGNRYTKAPKERSSLEMTRRRRDVLWEKQLLHGHSLHWRGGISQSRRQ